MRNNVKVALIAASISAALTLGACQSVNNNPMATFSSIAQLQKGFSSNVAATQFAQLQSEVSVNKSSANDKAAVVADFKQWIAGYTSNQAKAGSMGVAGKSAGKRGAILNEKGFEYNQLVKKGLIGAYQLSNAIVTVTESKASNQSKLESLTTYLLGDYSELAKNAYSSKYAGNEFKKYLTKYPELSKGLYAALNSAKANVNDDAKFNAAVYEALATAQKAVAKRTAYYLDYGVKLTDSGTPFDKAAHGVSEGLGFVYSLQFTYNPKTQKPYYTKAQIDSFLGSLNLYNKATAAKMLQAKSKEVSAKFGL